MPRSCADRLGAAAAHADDERPRVARQLYEQGRILALADVMKAVKAQVPGEVLEVELEVEDGAYVYEFKVLPSDGKLKEVEVDAATGKISRSRTTTDAHPGRRGRAPDRRRHQRRSATAGYTATSPPTARTPGFAATPKPMISSSSISACRSSTALPYSSAGAPPGANAGPDADRARRLGGARRGHRCRRRRLSRQAIPHGGADRARAGPDPPLGRARQRRDRGGRSRSIPGRCGFSCDGVPVPLSPLEYRLIAYLMHHKGRVVPPARSSSIFTATTTRANANALEALVTRLRKKLGADAIETRRGFGYLSRTTAHEPRLAALAAASRRSRLHLVALGASPRSGLTVCSSVTSSAGSTRSSVGPQPADRRHRRAGGSRDPMATPRRSALRAAAVGPLLAGRGRAGRTGARSRSLWDYELPLPARRLSTMTCIIHSRRSRRVRRSTYCNAVSASRQLGGAHGPGSRRARRGRAARRGVALRRRADPAAASGGRAPDRRLVGAGECRPQAARCHAQGARRHRVGRRQAARFGLP